MSTSLLEMNEAAAAGMSGERQVVALHLGGEVYGVDIACIHTVIMPQTVTQVPKAPDYVLGVMNLRGRILPVIDLRRRFGLPAVSEEQQKNARIVIVDVAGLSAAYDAYHASLQGREAPVIDGFTGDQRFFIAYAQTWATKMRDAALRQRITTDGHAPGSYRALTVRNLDAWYQAFGVKPGDKLYLAPEQRIIVW